jgi:hypothetical protein
VTGSDESLMRRPLLALLTVLSLLGPVAAAHASGLTVIRDCTYDEVMSKTYTQQEYRDALRELAADSDQYNNCRDVIEHAQEAALAAGRKPPSKGSGGAAKGAAPSAAVPVPVPSGGTKGGAGAIGSPPAAKQLTSATRSERQAIERARTASARPVSLDDTTVDPAKVGTVPDIGQVSNLPTPLAVLLALLLAGTLALAAARIRRLVHTRRA